MQLSSCRGIHLFWNEKCYVLQYYNVFHLQANMQKSALSSHLPCVKIAILYEDKVLRWFSLRLQRLSRLDEWAAFMECWCHFS